MKPFHWFMFGGMAATLGSWVCLGHTIPMNGWRTYAGNAIWIICLLVAMFAPDAAALAAETRKP